MKELMGLNEQQLELIQKSRRRVIESIGKNMDLYGITLSIGHLYGNMYFYNTPVTLDEMADTMGMSKTSMSTGMRTLLDLKMVAKVWEKGARKDLYEVTPDWYQNLTDLFAVKWRNAIEMNTSALKRSLVEMNTVKAEYPDDMQLNEVIDRDITKINEALAYYIWLGGLIDLFESGEIYTFHPKQDSKT